MIVDCAHVAPTVMHQVLDISAAPVVFSHSNARALCDHPRNVPDDVLARVPANDGLVMATFIPAFINEATRRWMLPLTEQLKLDPTAGRAEAIAALEKAQGPMPAATLEQLADHIEHIAAKVGRRRVGIGSDFFGSTHTPHGLADVTCYPHLLAEMFRRGWSDREVAGLAGRNFIRVFRAVEKAARP
jgi:membrane dipeptidase